jgi:hypothetical protein
MHSSKFIGADIGHLAHHCLRKSVGVRYPQSGVKSDGIGVGKL